MQLISSDHCPFCLRCLLVLEAKSIKCDVVSVDLTKKKDFVQTLSPYQRVPVLNHDEASIYESSIIMEYLEEVFPEPALLPAAPALRAEARFWIDFCNNRFMPAYFNLLKSSRGKERDRLREQLVAHLVRIDQVALRELSAERRYWMGEHVSLVDFAFYPFFERFADVEEYRGVEMPRTLIRLQSWLATLRANPAVKAFARPRSHYVEYFREFYAD